VSRNTVLWALERLQAEGYVSARVGDGSYVSAGLESLSKAAGSLPLSPLRHAISRQGQVVLDAVSSYTPLQLGPGFRLAGPDVASFPFALWDKLTRQIPLAQRRATAQYVDPAGDPALRAAIAHWLWASRGIRCEPSQVHVCSGAQQAIDLIGRLLLDARDEVLVEDPGYLGLRDSLVGNGMVARPAAVDAQGIQVEAAIARWPQARMAVVTPTHQFPTGVRLSLERRLALLDWANTTGAWIVEDDYNGEFQYGAHRLPALCSLRNAERVLHVGTFSKAMHPGLRMGFVVLPKDLSGSFALARAVIDRSSPGEIQAVLAQFISEGHLLRHLRRVRELYQARQRVLIDALAEASGNSLQLAPSERGMHLFHELPEGADDQSLSRQARDAGVFVGALSSYSTASSRRGWLFGYTEHNPAELREAARIVGPMAAAELASMGRNPARKSAGLRPI
jgi:GntR family transcriptional regulator/MocR family aminotransferase